MYYWRFGHSKGCVCVCVYSHKPSTSSNTTSFTNSAAAWYSKLQKVWTKHIIHQEQSQGQIEKTKKEIRNNNKLNRLNGTTASMAMSTMTSK